MTDPDEHLYRLAAESLAAGDPTGWFQRLYADAGSAVPWDRTVRERFPDSPVHYVAADLLDPPADWRAGVLRPPPPGLPAKPPWPAAGLAASRAPAPRRPAAPRPRM